jgi:hypothetical protein
MKLAEALLLRADMQSKLDSLRGRIARNAVVQEGESTHEDAEELIKDAFRVIGEKEALVVKINQTNLSSSLPNGLSLTEALALRESLEQQHSVLQHAVRHTQKEQDRYSSREIRWLSTLNVSDLEKQSEVLAKEIRELNATIQEANWSAEVA